MPFILRNPLDVARGNNNILKATFTTEREFFKGTEEQMLSFVSNQMVRNLSEELHKSNRVVLERNEEREHFEIAKGHNMDLRVYESEVVVFSRGEFENFMNDYKNHILESYGITEVRPTLSPFPFHDIQRDDDE